MPKNITQASPAGLQRQRREHSTKPTNHQSNAKLRETNPEIQQHRQQQQSSSHRLLQREIRIFNCFIRSNNYRLPGDLPI